MKLWTVFDDISGRKMARGKMIRLRASFNPKCHGYVRRIKEIGVISYVCSFC